MPIYEYQCQDCGHELETMHKVSAPLLVDCPSCGVPGLRKKLSASAFRLSGGGWYETDFKTGDKKRNLAGGGDQPPAAKAETAGGETAGAKAGGETAKAKDTGSAGAAASSANAP